MMTLRLYYDDSYLRDFSATVVGETTFEGTPAVVLDGTAFYPTSGGQPHDTGTLGTAHVTNVLEDPSGTILHVLDSPLALGPVDGRLDWERRFDHMQQHTGQHVLSQAFLKAATAATISFHLGKEISTIDITVDQPPQELIAEAEALANRIVFEDREVRTLTVDRTGLEALRVRKESQREGEIRVIDVKDFDRSPCGGTHVRRCGEIGLISVLGHERYKGGTRIEFVCGWRAFRAFRRDHETLKQLSKVFSAHADELPRLAAKVRDESVVLGRENSRLNERISELEALELLNAADKMGEVAVVRRVFVARALESVKLLAQKITAQAPAIAILGTCGDTAQAVIARSAEVPGNAGSVVKEVASRLGGKGGGRPELAQAGGIEPDKLEEWVRTAETCFAKLMLKSTE